MRTGRLVLEWGQLLGAALLSGSRWPVSPAATGTNRPRQEPGNNSAPIRRTGYIIPTNVWLARASVGVRSRGTPLLAATSPRTVHKDRTRLHAHPGTAKALHTWNSALRAFYLHPIFGDLAARRPEQPLVGAARGSLVSGFEVRLKPHKARARLRLRPWTGSYRLGGGMLPPTCLFSLRRPMMGGQQSDRRFAGNICQVVLT